MSTEVSRVGKGFTLVEILIVVVILGVLAVMVVPQFASASTDAKASSASAIINQVQKKILIYYGTNGDYPDEIDPDWFANRELPRNPFKPDVVDSVYYNLGVPASKTHPSVKDLRNPSLKVFWYNPVNGRFRARVPQQDSAGETLTLYNRVNGSRLISLTDESE